MKILLIAALVAAAVSACASNDWGAITTGTRNTIERGDR